MRRKWLQRLSRLKLLFRQNNKPDQVLVFMDWENIAINIMLSPGEPSLVERLDDCIRKIAERTERSIANVFIFMPPHASSVWGEQLYRLGFYIIDCPKITGTTRKGVDTADEIMINYAKMMLSLRTKRLKYLCLISGDKHFLPLIRRARLEGMKIILIASNPRSLAKEVIPWIDEGPYFLSSSCANKN